MYRISRTLTVAALVAAVALLVASCASPPEDTGAARSAGADEAAPAPDTATAGTDASGASAVPSFTFAAAGDLGANPTTAEGLGRLDRSAAEFFLALGDLDYDETETDAAWCDYVKKRLPTKGSTFPFELVAGNHEADTGSDGRVRHHAACLPDRLGSTGEYASQYAFTYPGTSPFAKFIMVSPRLTVDGHTYDYRRGTADRTWLVRQIDSAEDAGIEWVVVGMHYPCLSVGKGHAGCDSGRAVLDLLVRKKVDLLLTGHNHIYERSKQLALGDGCSRIAPSRFDRDCVADSGRDGVFRRGAGLVQVTSGRVGGRHQGVNPDDSHERWFTKYGGRTTGLTRYRLTPERLTARYLSTGGALRDSFVIE